MAKNEKKARFFCEYCDHEVENNASFCPYCGHFFSSVRCPRCGFTGEHNEFENGCPRCGYAMDESSKKSIKNYNKESLETNHISKKETHDDPLPFWIYGIAIVLLLGLLFFIFQYL